jgi:hypothetical protein
MSSIHGTDSGGNTFSFRSILTTGTFLSVQVEDHQRTVDEGLETLLEADGRSKFATTAAVV